jgi:hypothetical protein
MNPNDILASIVFGGDGDSSNVEDLSTSGGASDAGKVLAVNSNGNIEPVNLSVGQGAIAVDKNLSVSGAAADSKSVGDAITLTSEEKTSLIALLN